jgi:hypothetical protein
MHVPQNNLAPQVTGSIGRQKYPPNNLTITPLGSRVTVGRKIVSVILEVAMGGPHLSIITQGCLTRMSRTVCHPSLGDSGLVLRSSRSTEPFRGSVLGSQIVKRTGQNRT